MYASPNRRPRPIRVVAPMLAAALLHGCAPWDRTSADERQVNGALLALLTTPGKRICVDAATYGEPLAVFGAMLPAPDPARRPLYWRPPEALDPGRVLTNRDLVDVELRKEQVILPERPQTAPRLPLTVQQQLNGLAAQAAVMEADRGVRLDGTPAAPLATVRWWVRNRLDPSCGPIYTVSKPVFVENTAFLSVTAAHQGSTYAFRKTGTRWVPFAKWSTWLY